jgi:hypothetical protein
MRDVMTILDRLSEDALEACHSQVDELLGVRFLPPENLNRRQLLILKLMASGAIVVGMVDQTGDRIYVLHHEACLSDSAGIDRASTVRAGRLTFTDPPLVNSEEAQVCNRALIFDAQKLREAIKIRPSAEAEVVRTIRELEYGPDGRKILAKELQRQLEARHLGNSPRQLEKLRIRETWKKKFKLEPRDSTIAGSQTRKPARSRRRAPLQR